MILVKYDLDEMLGKMNREQITDLGIETVSQIQRVMPDENVIFLPDFVTISNAPLEYLIRYRDVLDKCIENEQKRQQATIEREEQKWME